MKKNKRSYIAKRRHYPGGIPASSVSIFGLPHPYEILLVEVLDSDGFFGNHSQESILALGIEFSPNVSFSVPTLPICNRSL